MLGKKHPTALGQPVSECWHEIWHILQPLIDTPFFGGPSTWMEDILLEINRHGFVEETHFTIAYSPLPDESQPSGIGGVLATVHEISEKVVAERRITVLRDLGARVVEARSAEDSCAVAAETLSKHPKDVPFALIYLFDADRDQAHLAGWAGISRGETLSPPLIRLSENQQVWNLLQVSQTEQLQVVEDLSRFSPEVPAGPWSDPPQQAVIAPIHSNIPHQLAGFFIAGVSSRLKLDDSYRSFIELAAAQIATAVATARAYEEEKRRVEALSELDRAKTTFFSNVSHEFRTPLTLMLGPLEEALWNSGLPKEIHDQLETVRRNSLRLQKLVNNLLDFSRIEAGRMQARYEPVDLSVLTADLASAFRSAIETAGIRFVVNCPALPAPVYVDRGMWEKIVLNLISNAFKFTFEGEIEVCLKSLEGSVELTVRDTGTGIPAAELPRVFERFHRVENAQRRTYEGSGIGLALVQELARLHGGSVHVQSEFGSGTVFTVTIPYGHSHLPAEHINASNSHDSSTAGATAFVQEALRWSPGTAAIGQTAASVLPEHSGAEALFYGKRILVADDNSDMRKYLHRLLAPYFVVQTAADGQAALELAKANSPDLVLTDVMMPRLDGFGLLRALREDPATATVPIVMLSARAGEESRVEGIQAGADDYLIKPFSSRELLARIEGVLKLQMVRQQAEQTNRLRTAQFETLLNQAPLGVYLVDNHFRIRQVNPTAMSIFGNIPNLIGRDFEEVIHILWEKNYEELVKIFRHTLETGEPYASVEQSERRLDRNRTQYYEWRIDRITLPEGAYGVVCYFRDISNQVRARAAIAESEVRFRTALSIVADIVWTADPNGAFISEQPNWAAYTGQHWEQMQGFGWLNAIHPDDRLTVEKTWRKASRIQGVYESQGRLWHASSQQYRYFVVRATPLLDAEGNVAEWVGAYTDVHEQRAAEEMRRESQNQMQKALAESEQLGKLKDEFLATLSHELRTPLNSILGWAHMLQSKTVDPEMSVSAISAIYSSARVQTQIIDDLLDVSRILGGKMSLRPKKITLAEILNSAINTVGHAIRAKQITLDVRYDQNSDRIALYADPQRLQQVFWNILFNAVKFSTQGAHIDIVVQPSASEVSVVIRDYGVGIDPAFLPHVFERFRQADSSTSRKHGGLGLGLAITRNLVELHGGTIVAQSGGLGSGATFTVNLPLADHAIVSAIPFPSSQSSTAYNFDFDDRRVLLVDDDPQTLQIMRTAFELCRAEIRSCSSAAECLEILKQWRPHLLISDIGMPGQDGYWLIREVRALSFGRKLPAIALTAYALPADRARVLDAGFNVFVVKPAEPAELLATANMLLEQSVIEPPKTEPREFMLAGKKVLLVEDDLLSAEVFRFVLEREGLQFRSAARVSHAMDLVQQWNPDLVISDLGLPDEDGFSLIKKIRSLPAVEQSTIPAIALTGYGAEEGERAVRAGFQIYKCKPLEPTALLPLLNQLLIG